VRPGIAADLAEVEAIQHSAPEAAQWRVADYLDQDFRVAIVGKSITGFIVLRNVAQDEREILNLAVAPDWRRQGVGRALLRAALEGFRGAVFLEVRESNAAAIAFYKLNHFQEVSRRSEYYQSPLETGIVMKFHSC
jgi:ribosomal-protein-alanine N-acetyltransferase